MNIDRIVGELEQERDRIARAIASLKGTGISGSGRKIAAGNGRSVRRRRGMSSAARKRISVMMKKRWAERRKKAVKSA